jgi:hypothetical protein
MRSEHGAATLDPPQMTQHVTYLTRRDRFILAGNMGKAG